MEKNSRTLKQRLEILRWTSIGGANFLWNDSYRATLASLGLKLTTEPHNFGDYIQAPLPCPNSVNPWPFPSWIIEAEKDERMNVAALIEILKTMPQDALVCYGRYSEQCLMEADDIGLARYCEPRPDGWIQNERPDMPTRQYVIFPGN